MNHTPHTATPRREALRNRPARLTGFFIALTLSACAGLSRQPETGQPRGDEGPPYPVTLEASAARRDKALAAWASLTGGAVGVPPAPELQPVTGVLRALPASPATPLRLPQVGGANGVEQTEEELRESLRRFLASAAPLLGVEAETLSLAERVDNPDGTRRVLYRQTPFPHPLRGGYGLVQVIFTRDLRVTSLSSTALPEAERLRRALRDVRPALNAADAASRLANRPVTYRDAGGAEATLNAGTPGESAARELVVYPRVNPAAPASLELRLAWEVAVGPGAPPAILAYVDALTGDVIGAEAAASTTGAPAPTPR